jgi:signal transduction histidine kinase
VSLVAIPTHVAKTADLAAIAIGDLVVALVALLLPWRSLSATALLALPGCLMLGWSTYVFGDFGPGTGPFVVLAFAWLGLHYSRRVILAVLPIATVAYLAGLAAAHADGALLATTAVLMPVALAVALVINDHVTGHLRAQDLLRRQEAWRAALTTSLAHDLRSPLTTIGGALEVAEEHPQLPAELKPVVAAARRQAARVIALAVNVLDAERINNGELRLDLEDLDLADLASNIAVLSGDPSISVHIDPGFHVRADRTRLEQMILNLVTNALRYGAAPVHLGARTQGPWVEIFVRDHGDGVAIVDETRLFERVHDSRSRQDSMGLGLWIVRTLAEAHHGTVGYRAKSPGAEFTIRLPARVAAD